ncbi:MULTISPECIES: RNA polymerase sigma factor [unclassified Thiothrix]|uniref:RNA polymerase sigma factor n=2 Tax=Thiothrix TaxID=1030 RepID=UPI0025DD2BA8|nr:MULTISPECIES: RNA polymerase sigma factor [unclassified Thiothrix]HRJ93152.1 RNA polymerase sigma factor [Candidatus Thiothrix moscowensis]
MVWRTEREMMDTTALITGHNDPLKQDSPGRNALASMARMNSFLRGVEHRAFVIARLATQDDEEALDIVQDAMFKLVQKYSSHSDGEWGALFHAILHSRINDWHRRQKVRNRWRVFFFRSDDDEDDFSPEENIAQTQFPEPEEQVLQAEMSKTMLNAVGTLPLRQQQALLLRAWEGYDIAETAKIMKCSEGSVKTHYSRAIHSLREKLGEYQ